MHLASITNEIACLNGDTLLVRARKGVFGIEMGAETNEGPARLLDREGADKLREILDAFLNTSDLEWEAE